MQQFHASVKPLLEELRGRFPQTPFLALGQTIWWDEPMKAVLRRMLDELSLGGTTLFGVHDTDYFAKLRGAATGSSRFALMPHNDGSTKDLWSAAGEISQLFGSETFPTRQDFLRHGVPFGRLARAASQGDRKLLDETTEAWGWRGMVYTGSRDLIVHNLPLADMGDAVERMLTWGFESTHAGLVDTCCRDEAGKLADSLVGRASDYQAQNPGGHLSAMYQALLPQLLGTMLGSAPKQTDVVCTAHLLNLSPETAHLPRFNFLDLFLAEKTRAIARECYNQAVAGSEMYTLDRFGLGAIPFDVVTPQHGRGTLRVTLRAVHIETPNPIRIPTPIPVTSVAQLAEVLTAELGHHVTVVGKAVALISMLAHEFLFVFNEEGSAYVRRTRKMNDLLAAAGIDFSVHPILRVKYRTWDSLRAAGATLALPSHLAAAFGRKTITCEEFAQNWRTVVQEQTDLLTALKQIRGARSLLDFLSHREGGDWPEQTVTHAKAKEMQRSLWTRAHELKVRVQALYAELRTVKTQIVEAEKQKGDHFRRVADWTPEENARRASLEDLVNGKLAERRDLMQAIEDNKAQRAAKTRGSQAETARAAAMEIENLAETARMRLVRNAILTRDGLTHTDHRPSAWWLPMVDPSGGWFDEVVKTTELYAEPLRSSS